MVGHTYRAAAAAAAFVPIPGINLSPALEIRVANVEQIVAYVTGENCTFDDIFRSLSTFNVNVNNLREEMDCRASPGTNVSVDSVGHVGMKKQTEVWQSPLRV